MKLSVRPAPGLPARSDPAWDPISPGGAVFAASQAGHDEVQRASAQHEGHLAVILLPASGESIKLNWWNWRPLVALLVRADILPKGEREERCLSNFSGGGLSGEEALRAAQYIEDLLPTIESDQRLLLDGTLTEQPINYQASISELTQQEIWVGYSVKREVLVLFADFCRRSGGFEVS